MAKFDTQTFTPLASVLDFGTATASGGAAELNALNGQITTEALTTVSGSSYTLTLTNAAIRSRTTLAAEVSVAGTNTGGIPVIGYVTPATGSVEIVVWNVGASALNGTLVISFGVLRR